MRAWDLPQPAVTDFSRSQLVAKPKPIRANQQKNHLVTQSVPSLTSISNLEHVAVNPEDLDREHSSSLFPAELLPEHTRGRNALKFKQNFKQRFDVPDMMAMSLRRADAKAQKAMENREQELQEAFLLEQEMTSSNYMDETRKLKTVAIEEKTQLLAEHENEIDHLIKQAEKQRMQELRILEEKVRMQWKLDKEDCLEQCKHAEMVAAQKQLQAQVQMLDSTNPRLSPLTHLALCFTESRDGICPQDRSRKVCRRSAPSNGSPSCCDQSECNAAYVSDFR
jgi:hypothetical protein